MSSTPIWKGLELLSLALIFAPEPFTTPIGLGLLAYARKKRKEQQQEIKGRPRPRHSSTDFYHYQVGMIRGSSIAYHVSPTRQGQLPLARSTISKLYENRKEWEYYRQKLNMQTRVSLARSHHHFTDFYHYRMLMIRGSSIAYHVSPTRQGQLPLAHSTISKLYENRKEWEYYRQKLNAQTRVNLARPHASQPAGLLKTPFLRYQARLPARRRIP